MTCRTCPSLVVPRRGGCAHQLCPNCWVRWKAAGFPEDGPPAPVRPWGRTLAARTEDWAWLRSASVAVAVAAARLGVSVRTAERYEVRRLAGKMAATRAGHAGAA